MPFDLYFQNTPAFNPGGILDEKAFVGDIDGIWIEYDDVGYFRGLDYYQYHGHRRINDTVYHFFIYMGVS